MSFIDPEGLMCSLLVTNLKLPFDYCETFSYTPDPKLVKMTKALAASFRKMFEEEAHAILENNRI